MADEKKQTWERKSKTRTITITDEENALVDRLAAVRDKPRSRVIVEAVTNELQRVESK